MEDLEELEIPEAVKALSKAAKDYVSAVDTLRGPLEADTLAAVEACWEFEEKPVQLRSKPLMRKRVRLLEARYEADADEQFLAVALKQWQDAAEGAVGSAALELRTAERRLLWAVDRLVEAEQRPHVLLCLLDLLLETVAASGAPVLLSCPSTFTLLRHLALYVGASALELPEDEAVLYRGLVVVLARHVQRTDWSLALLHPPPHLLLPLLDAILPAGSSTDAGAGAGAGREGLEVHGDGGGGDGGQQGGGGGHGDGDGAPGLRAAMFLLEQLPWSVAGGLPDEALHCQVLPRLYGVVERCCAVMAAGGEDGEELLLRTAGILTALAAVVGTETRAMVHVHLMLTLMAVSRGTTPGAQQAEHPQLYEALPTTAAAAATATVSQRGGEAGLRRALGDPMTDEELGCWAWVSLAWSNNCVRGGAAAARVLEGLDWHQLAPTLPGHLAMLVMVSTAKGLSCGADDVLLQSFVDWCWGLLAAPTGRQLAAASPADDDTLAAMHALCITQAPDADDCLAVLWGLQRCCLVVALLAAAAEAAAGGGGGGGGGGGPPLPVGALVDRAALFPTLVTLTRSDPRGHAYASTTLLAVVGPLCQLPVQVGSGCVGGLGRVLDALLLGSGAAMQAQRLQQGGGDGGADVCAAVRQQLYELMVANLSGRAPGGADGRSQADAPFVRAAALWAAAVAESCARNARPLPAAAAALLNDAAQLLFFYWPGIACGEQPSYLGNLAAGLGAGACGQLQRKLLALHRGDPDALPWLPVLACWLHTACRACHVPDSESALGTPTSALSPNPSLLLSGDTDEGGTWGCDADMEGSNSRRLRALGELEEEGEQEGDSESGGLMGTDSIGAPLDFTVEAMLAREREFYLQVQDAALIKRHGSAVFALWEEVSAALALHGDSLRDALRAEEVQAALLYLSQLCRTSSPRLAAIAQRWAALAVGGADAEAAAGGDADAVRGLSRNPDAVRELMLAYPLKLQPGAFAKAAQADGVVLGSGAHDGGGVREQLPLQCYPRRPPVTPDSFAPYLLQQADVAEDVRDIMAVLRLCSFSSDTAPFVQESRDFGLRGEDSDTQLLEGQVESGILDFVAQAQGKLWECSMAWSAQLSGIGNQLRSIVRERYCPVHLQLLDPDRFEGNELIETPEAPGYASALQANREAARAVVAEFADGEPLAAVAAALHQVEVLLLHARLEDDGGAAAGAQGASPQEAEMKSQLLAVCARVMLDGSTPPMAMPMMQALYSRAAARVPLTLATKLRVARSILQALGVNPGGSSVLGDNDAGQLLRALLDPEAMLAQERWHDFCLTLRQVLRHCPRGGGRSVATILSAFDVAAYIAAMAARGALDSSDVATAPYSGDRASRATGLNGTPGSLGGTAAALGGTMAVPAECGGAPAVTAELGGMMHVPVEFGGPAASLGGGGGSMQVPEELGGGAGASAGAGADGRQGMQVQAQVAGSGPGAAVADGGSGGGGPPPLLSLHAAGVEGRQPPALAGELLGLALEALGIKGGVQISCQVLESLLCLQPSAYYCAVLHVGIAAPSPAARVAVLALLQQVPGQLLPLGVLLHAAEQVADALSTARLAYSDVPQQLLRTLCRPSCLWEAVAAELGGRQARMGDLLGCFVAAGAGDVRGAGALAA